MLDAPTMVPRVLYTYWEGPMNPIVATCLTNMRRLNPDWQVVIANRSTCEAICDKQCPTGMSNWRQQSVSDWFRLQCLAAHGGVWLDATCLCLKPLEAWVDVNLPGVLQGFEAPIKKKGLLENWALACPPGCLFVQAWAKELDRCAHLGRANYRQTLPPYAFPGKGAIRFELPYFTTHQAALKILQEHPEFPVRMSSSRAHGGPFDYSLEGLLAFIISVMEGRSPTESHAFFKINGCRRRQIMKTLGLTDEKDAKQSEDTSLSNVF